MDGTGELFTDFIAALPPAIPTLTARYPIDEFLDYDALVAFVEKIFPTTPFLVVAESFSSPVGVLLAAKRPPNMKGLVLCAGFVSNPMPRLAMVATIFASSALLRMNPPEWILRKYLIGESAPATLVQQLSGAIRRVKRTVLLERAQAVINCDAKNALSATVTPMLYLQGRQDCVVDAKSVDEIAARRADMQLKVIEAPHLVLQCAPRDSAEAIMGFVNSLRD